MAVGRVVGLVIGESGGHPGGERFGQDQDCGSHRCHACGAFYEPSGVISGRLQATPGSCTSGLRGSTKREVANGVADRLLREPPEMKKAQ